MAKQTPEEKLNKKEHKFKAKLAKQKAPKAFKAITAPSVPEIVPSSIVTPLKYRYYCEFCSNTGFYAEYRGEGLLKTCQSCGKTIHTKITNYLLTQWN